MITTQPAASLERRLGPLDAAAIVVSNVIGGGLFFVPFFVAQPLTNARAILLVWLGGGLLAFAGAMAYAELAAMRPRAGGEYVYLRDAFGPLVPEQLDVTVAGFSGATPPAPSRCHFVGHSGRPQSGGAVTSDRSSLIISPRISSPAVIALLVAHVRGLRVRRPIRLLAGAGSRCIFWRDSPGAGASAGVPAPAGFAGRLALRASR